MMRTVRIWATELDPDVPIGEWGLDRLGGAWGEGAPWRFEPTYWSIREMPGSEMRWEPGYTDHWIELTREQARELDAKFRTAARHASGNIGRALDEQLTVMDRALGPGSPFAKSMVVEYEWEHGLPD